MLSNLCFMLWVSVLMFAWLLTANIVPVAITGVAAAGGGVGVVIAAAPAVAAGVVMAVPALVNLHSKDLMNRRGRWIIYRLPLIPKPVDLFYLLIWSGSDYGTPYCLH